MPSEAWSSDQRPPQKSLESLKQTFKQRLDAILNKQLTVENIETFADEALDKTVELTHDILKEYQHNPNVYPNQISLDKQVQENEAFAIFGLPNISEILQSVIDVKDKIDAIKIYLSEPKNIVDKVVIPPQYGSPTEIKSGSGTGIEEKKLVPRLITLLYILEADFDIQKEQVKITEGKVSPEMMRKTPYVRVEVEDLERIIYICDEEGNASYLFDTEKLEEFGIQTENIDISNKGIINDLMARHGGIGARIIQTKHWRSNMQELLENSIPEKQVVTEKSGRSVSEFTKREKSKFLSFEEFQAEVKTLHSLYIGKDSLQAWYTNEKKEHSNWPSAPHLVYKDKGWIGLPELIGRENKFKKEYPSFEVFKKEVKTLYPGKGSVQGWYREESPKHTNWPSHPDEIYGNNGWKDWSELVSKENFLKREFLPWENFKQEVRNLYSGQGGIDRWYRKERENNQHWPSKPEKIYKNKGWTSWPELVGREIRYGKEFLSFEKFQAEVKNLYPGEGDIQEWYKKERIKHPNWHSAPHTLYRDKGWLGWSELVGVISKYKQEHLSFTDFQEEVRTLYNQETRKGSVINWYIKEKEKHQNWYANPQVTYKNKGWEGWPELVGIKNIKKIEYPSFQNFQAEARAVYTGKDNVSEWYKQERLKHPNWPYKPDKKYKDEGWEGWPELVSRENRTKKEFLSFDSLYTEVKALYPGKGSIQKWYFKESQKHENWPSNPPKKYRDAGWTNWRGLLETRNGN